MHAHTLLFSVGLIYIQFYSSSSKIPILKNTILIYLAAVVTMTSIHVTLAVIEENAAFTATYSVIFSIYIIREI